MRGSLSRRAVTEKRIWHGQGGRGVVVQYSNGGNYGSGHETITRASIAKRIAALKGCDFAGQYNPGASYGAQPVYFVPDDTLVGLEAARRLGIFGEDDLFGGVVPYPFVATKTITHPLVAADASAPAGWSNEFHPLVEDAVLFGFTAFTRSDARHAGRLVLRRGAARLKPARGVGGRGQVVATGTAELDAHIETLGAAEIERYGIVIEQNFADIVTYSIGQARVSDSLVSYYGRQILTTDNSARQVYGGSDLVVVRGDYDALLDLELAAEVRRVVAQTRAFDSAAAKTFPGLLASRRNYDVAGVVDVDGTRRTGVLEQSWRIGGATPAEIAALEAFRADAELSVVRSTCREVYGAEATAPAGAAVHFRGLDDGVGSMIKYSMVRPYVEAR